MPTKLNKAGNQQNYVPAGNGDASGEYGDNASGSNIHFTNFAKPKDDLKDETKEEDSKSVEKDNKNTQDENVVVEQKGNKPIDTKPKKTFEDLKGSITKSLGGKLTPNGKKLIKNLEESNADPRYVSLMANMYETGNYQIKLGKNNSAYFNPYIGVSLGAESLEDSGLYGKGSAFFHESGHALDFSFPKSDDDESPSLWNRQKIWSMDYTSEKYGMTLQESIDDELKKYAGEENKDKIYKELTDGLKKTDPEYKKIVESYEKNLKEYKDKIELRDKVDKERDEYIESQIAKLDYPSDEEMMRRIEEEEITWSDYHSVQHEKWERREEFGVDYDSKHPDFNRATIVQDINNAYTEYKKMSKAKMHKEFQSLGDMSDMLQASAGYSICGGHTGDYFLGEDGKENQATECFAEITQAKAVNKDSLEVLKKYIPRTLEIYEEIIGEIENGR